jgi:hypothetical protein
MGKVARVKNDIASETIANAPLAINNTWDEFVSEEPKQPVVTLADAAEMVQQAFGEAEPIPTCSHGVRTIKSGVSASGKAWQGAWLFFVHKSSQQVAAQQAGCRQSTVSAAVRKIRAAQRLANHGADRLTSYPGRR